MLQDSARSVFAGLTSTSGMGYRWESGRTQRLLVVQTRHPALHQRISAHFFLPVSSVNVHPHSDSTIQRCQIESRTLSRPSPLTSTVRLSVQPFGNAELPTNIRLTFDSVGSPETTAMWAEGGRIRGSQTCLLLVSKRVYYPSPSPEQMLTFFRDNGPATFDWR